MKKFWDNFEEIVGAGLFVVLFGVLLSQIFFRKVLNSPLTWSEEFSILLFVYVGMLGVSLGIKRGIHVYIDFIYNRYSETTRRIVGYVIDAVVFVSIVSMIGVGYVVFQRKMNFDFITLKVSLGYMYAALPLVGSLMLVRFFQGFLAKRRGG